ncbi:MAG: hypothetical protein ACJA01_004347 [Saprospiraceae bacterium]|jgi:hypothetical protein
MQNILKVGLFYGLFSILTALIIGAIDKSLLLNTYIEFGIMLVGIVFLVIAGRKFFRDPEEGLLSYGGAVKKLILACFIGFVISQVFSVARYSNDEEFKVLYKDLAINSSETGLRMGMNMAGASEADIEDNVAKIREKAIQRENENSSYPFTWAKLPIVLLMSAVYSLFFSLIVAIFVREKDTANA